MNSTAGLVIDSGVQCSKCRIRLAIVIKQKHPDLIQDPKFTYYHRCCDCDSDDASIIRVPLQPIEYELVEGASVKPEEI